MTRLLVVKPTSQRRDVGHPALLKFARVLARPVSASAFTLTNPVRATSAGEMNPTCVLAGFSSISVLVFFKLSARRAGPAQPVFSKRLNWIDSSFDSPTKRSGAKLRPRAWVARLSRCVGIGNVDQHNHGSLGMPRHDGCSRAVIQQPTRSSALLKGQQD